MKEANIVLKALIKMFNGKRVSGDDPAFLLYTHYILKWNLEAIEAIALRSEAGYSW